MLHAEVPSLVHTHTHLRDVSPVWCKGNLFRGAGWDGIFPHSCDRLAIRSRLAFLHSSSAHAHSCPLLLPQPPLCSHHVTETERFIHTTRARFMTEIRSTDQSNARCDWNVQTGAIGRQTLESGVDFKVVWRQERGRILSKEYFRSVRTFLKYFFLNNCSENVAEINTYTHTHSPPFPLGLVEAGQCLHCVQGFHWLQGTAGVLTVSPPGFTADCMCRFLSLCEDHM